MNKIGRPLTSEETDLIDKITSFSHLQEAIAGTTDDEKKRFLKLSEILNKQNVGSIPRYMMCTIFGTELMIQMQKGAVKNEASA